MKKQAILLLCVLLALACAAPARAETALPAGGGLTGYSEVWYVDYADTVVNDVNGTTSKVSSNSGGEVRWVTERCFAAGFEAGSLLGTDSDINVVPVDLSPEENTVYVYAIVTRKVVIGLLYAGVNVTEGTLTIEGQVKGADTFFRGEPLLIIYPSVSSLAEAGVICEPGVPVSIRDELDGAPAVLVELDGYASYATVAAANAQDGSVKYYAMQDYWKNENKWKNYRSRMLDVLNKVNE